MRLTAFGFCVWPALAAATALGGTIDGTVVNTTSGAARALPVRGRAASAVQGAIRALCMVATDKQGRFRIGELPLGEKYLYLIGANRQGVFYPGPRLTLTDLHPAARVELAVCDAVTRPNPLVLNKMEITIRPETGLLKVTESLLIDNPSRTTYIGEPARRRPGRHPGPFHPAGLRADNL